MNGYQLTRRWFNFTFDNTEAKVQHTAIYCWLIELNNRLGWKNEFTINTQFTMEGLSIGNKNTYLSALTDLENWGFIKTIRPSVNQNYGRVITLRCYDNDTAVHTATTTAMDTALIQQNDDNDNGSVPIVKQVNQQTTKPLNHKPIKTQNEFQELLNEHEENYGFAMINDFCNYWTETDQKGKMRFQAQKFFDIKKRLATWKRNSTDFPKNKKEASTDVPPENAPYKPPHQKGVDFSNCIPKTKQ
jgi:hypothetical protein